MTTKPTSDHQRFAKVADLVAYPHNARQHSHEQVAEIAKSIKQFGFTAPVLIDERGMILAGHGRVMAAQLLDLEQVPVVVIAGLSENDKRAYVLADNRIAEKATWDQPLLIGELQTLKAADYPLDLTGFAHTDLTTFEGEAKTAYDRDADAAPAYPPLPTSRPGDLWRMGDHRILCGDATQLEHVAALIGTNQVDALFTDPPYCSGGFQEAGRAAGSVGVRSKTATRTVKPSIANDKLSTRGYLALLKSVIGLSAAPMLYVFTDWRMWINLYDVAESSGYGVRNMIVWDKGSAGMGRGWRTQHELVMFAAKTPVAFKPANAQGNVIQSKRTGNLLHPTQKPVDLLVDILAVTDMARVIYDPFAGAGSTLIAAELESRTCLLMELSPGFVDVTVQRWQEHTKKAATLAADGRTYAVVAAERAQGVPDRAKRASG